MTNQPPEPAKWHDPLLLVVSPGIKMEFDTFADYLELVRLEKAAICDDSPLSVDDLTAPLMYNYALSNAQDYSISISGTPVCPTVKEGCEYVEALLRERLAAWYGEDYWAFRQALTLDRVQRFGRKLKGL